jgi:nitrite reductase/ring-hydroxylating ferredoxin subunit
MAWLKVLSLGGLHDGAVVGTEVDGVSVALYNVSGEIFATHGICTHALALLSEGWLEDGKIECPLHQGQFDVRSGKALSGPVTEDIRTYAVKVEGGEVFVDLELSAAPAENGGSSAEFGRSQI